MILYEFIDRRGHGVVSAWRLQAAQQAKLDRRLQDLRDAEDRGFAQGSLIHGTTVRGIYKVKIKGGIQLRPLLCYGPVDPQHEVTFLAQAIERDRKLTPPGVEDLALERREELHEHLSKRRLIT